MNKLFSKEANYRECRTRIMGALMSIVMAASVCMPVQAAGTVSKSGTTNSEPDGTPCYATLSVDDNATASTVSPEVAYHYVKVNYIIYYADDSGRVQKGTVQNNSSASVSVTAYIQGEDIEHKVVTSHHTIKSGAYTWNADLTISD
ncbi:MAG: hypothetical protein J1F42_07425 [Lachnospiraceae bacterium]|nr:hypothetical protein [Lachnospiraceae bacterium]